MSQHDDTFTNGVDEYADFVPSRASDFEGTRSTALAGLARLTTGIPHVCIITTVTARTTARHRIVSVGLVSLTQPGEGNMVDIMTLMSRPGASDKADWGAIKIGKLASKGGHIAATEETCVHVYESGSVVKPIDAGPDDKGTLYLPTIFAALLLRPVLLTFEEKIARVKDATGIWIPDPAGTIEGVDFAGPAAIQAVDPDTLGRLWRDGTDTRAAMEALFAEANPLLDPGDPVQPSPAWSALMQSLAILHRTALGRRPFGKHAGIVAYTIALLSRVWAPEWVAFVREDLAAMGIEVAP
jgi:hypothetical protein